MSLYVMSESQRPGAYRQIAIASSLQNVSEFPNQSAGTHVSQNSDTMKTPKADPSRPERWAAGPTEAGLLRLEIPPDVQREREFEISVAMLVRALESAATPWHELRVYADGQLEWSRRIPTAADQPHDGLEMRFRRRVPAQRRLSLLAQAECGGGRRLRLTIEADEC